MAKDKAVKENLLNEEEEFNEAPSSPEPVLIGVGTFCAMKGLPFYAKARLEYYAQTSKLAEQTAEEWETIFSTL